MFMVNNGRDAKQQIEDKTMKTNTRFIKGIVDTAAKEDTQMPWARGARRSAFIAKRKEIETPRKSA